MSLFLDVLQMNASYTQTLWLSLLKLSAAVVLPTCVQVVMNSTLANPHSKACDSFLDEIILLDTL